jgi:UDP-glucose 4-epimerase
MRVLVTGGAGYIGSHAIIELLQSGNEVYVIDNLSNGHEEVLRRVSQLCDKECNFLNGDIRNTEDLNRAFSSFKPQAVMHFAGLKSVEESSLNPLKYYENNVIGSIRLLQAMDTHNCKLIVFSSSATVYGTPQYLPLDESHPLCPANPYGQTKLNVENILRDWSTDGRKAISLRYFNPVGAHESGLIGEDSIDVPNNLMPYIDQVAIGKRPKLKIFGDDYDTRDGTGERDYIHVTDLALAHLSTLYVLEGIESFEVMNIGTGVGVTVKELVKIYELITNKDIPFEVVGRRQGDIACSIACPKKANQMLNWNAELTINDAISSSNKWRIKNPDGYKN